MLVTAYLNGSTAGTPPGKNDHERAKRGTVTGWSSAAVRRHTKWLYSIDSPELSGEGYAVTLTIRDCPESAADWTKLRRAFLMRLERAGLIRNHWLTEWQRRGVPHLHGALYFPEGFGYTQAVELIYTAWLQVAAEYSPSFRSQDVKPIEGAMGWLQYLSKHASRGVRHYQRMGHPEGWQTTGRLWGAGGDWPEVEPMQFDLSRTTGHRYRRLVRAWTIADARKSGDAKRIAWARGMLSCSDPKLSAVRGVSGWVPEPISLGFIALLLDQGEGVIQRVNTQEDDAAPDTTEHAEVVPLLALRD